VALLELSHRRLADVIRGRLKNTGPLISRRTIVHGVAMRGEQHRSVRLCIKASSDPVLTRNDRTRAGFRH
jgi:hypothetical protein